MTDRTSLRRRLRKAALHRLVTTRAARPSRIASSLHRLATVERLVELLVRHGTGAPAEVGRGPRASAKPKPALQLTVVENVCDPCCELFVGARDEDMLAVVDVETLDGER